MGSLSRPLTLYVEPDQGPIKKIVIDLMVVEEQGLGVADYPAGNRDRLRKQAIVMLIRKQLPKVNPESFPEALTAIVRHMAAYSSLEGMGVRVGGIIDPDGSAASQPPVAQNPTPSIHDQMDWQSKLRELAEATERLRRLQSENDRLSRERDASRAEADALRSQSAQARENASQAQWATQQTQQEISDLQHQIGKLQVENDDLTQRLQTTIQQSVSREEALGLRAKLAESEKKEASLRDQVAERDQTIAGLQDNLRRLTMGDASAARGTGILPM